jgi:hypothetical protein
LQLSTWAGGELRYAYAHVELAPQSKTPFEELQMPFIGMFVSLLIEQELKIICGIAPRKNRRMSPSGHSHSSNEEVFARATAAPVATCQHRGVKGSHGQDNDQDDLCMTSEE